jgi:signal transduction histidine kinase
MTLIFAITILSAIVAAALALYAWRRRSTPGATSFSLLMSAVALWSVGVVFGLASPDLPTKMIWAKFVFFGIVTVPFAWFTFTLEYTGRERWLTTRMLLLLAVEPFITLALAWTNEAHGLVYTSTVLDSSSGYPMVQATFGVWTWVHTVYAYLAILAGSIILGWAAIRMPQLYRRQAIVLLIGSLVPWISNIISVAGLSPLPLLDLTPLSFTLTGIVFSWGLFQYRLLDIVPVAREMVIEQMSDGLMVLDVRDRVADINPALQRTIGLPIVKILGQRVDVILPMWNDLSKSSTIPVATHTEIMLGESDQRRDYNLRIAPLFDQRQHFTGRVVTLHDITDLHRTQRELEKAKNAAQAADHAKSNFLATVSYELRTPLNTINGYSSSLLADAKINSPTSIGYLEKINLAAQHLLNLANNLLELTKLEMGTLAPNPHVFDLTSVVREVVSTVQPLADKNDNTIQIHFDNVAGMNSDKDKVQQILLRLTHNACKFTRHGRVTLDIHREDGWVTFYVRDTGVGIAPDHLPHLFEPFTQSDSTIVRQYGDTGLSLALSKRYCTMLGGSIQVESELGEGSLFTVRLPIRLEAA